MTFRGENGGKIKFNHFCGTLFELIIFSVYHLRQLILIKIQLNETLIFIFSSKALVKKKCKKKI